MVFVFVFSGLVTEIAAFVAAKAADPNEGWDWIFMSLARLETEALWMWLRLCILS